MSRIRVLTLRCATGHVRELPAVDDELAALVKVCVLRRLARCDHCEGKIVEVVEPS